jgi:hypothetical protein
MAAVWQPCPLKRLSEGWQILSQRTIDGSSALDPVAATTFLSNERAKERSATKTGSLRRPDEL